MLYFSPIGFLVKLFRAAVGGSIKLTYYQSCRSTQSGRSQWGAKYKVPVSPPRQGSSRSVEGLRGGVAPAVIILLTRFKHDGRHSNGRGLSL
jgi:hypothetical protein